MFVRTENFRTFIHLYPIVTAIIALQIGLWLIFLIPVPAFSLFFSLFAGFNAGIANGEWWRLITPIFLHTGFYHLFFNTVSLILFAPALERILNRVLFLIIYFGSGIFANLATYWLEPLAFTHVGASGAIFGLFGVYLFMVLFRKDLIDAANSQVVITILVIGVIMTFLNTNINIAAHLFGLIGGFLLGSIFLRSRKTRSPWR
ncbi:rhomboid family intramembrane serine protease [Metabacillus arenae]|uniref:Rhomboid family intramembrane serine protease n=1 Tax=Metabacillus arenae TaxID=2771434 RepID=A0A926NQG5_9BACI|nr:rhomboid family intramembrane serine protease [Metabacillus arenae]MBD1382152.1 rhomboid family intramembrane serine protease [Metabacillus arenae]